MSLFENGHPTYFESVASGNKGKAFSFDTVFSFGHLDDDVRRHLKRVYLLLLFT